MAPNIAADQPDLSPGSGTVKDVAATHQALDTMGAPPGPAQQGPGGSPQGGGAQQPQPGPPGGPTQPAPQPDQGQGRLDMNQVFPPMPQLEPQIPWRESLRNLANHPDAGPALRGLADQISQQHGPK